MNGPENTGPEGRREDRPQPFRSAVNGDRSAPPTGPADSEPPADEQALRRLLQQSVAEVQPSEDALDHLLQAVPARRARRRQALVGLAAATVLLGTAAPAVVHVSRSGGSDRDRTSVAGHGEDAHGGTGQGKGPGNGYVSPGQSHDAQRSKNPDDKRKHGTSDGKESGGGGASRGPGPSSTMAASSPSCGAAELGNQVASVGTPDASGRVYGSFRVSNISLGNCTVDGPGSVSAAALGTADATRISVVDHTAGDAATGLPAPSAEQSPLVLRPGQTYEVRFAWVPSATCTADGGGSGGDGGGDGGSAGPSPDPTPSEGAGGGGGGDQSGVDTQTNRVEPSSGGSVTVAHTAEPGSPAAEATIPDACAGTLYRTGILQGS
ncbi:hypothetical protein [Streptomyces sp. NPDC058045]|uniref:hypothetical protein n=1 Tax=Streptomyces sp. NPDC058045 TaxID=3346311 RepID=UPI0036EBA3F2